MKPFANTLFITSALLLLLSCSKDSDGESNQKAYFPKTISLAYGSGETVLYQLSYNSKNQLAQMTIERNSLDETTRLISNFDYNDTGKLVNISSEDVQSGSLYNFTFDHGVNGTVTNVGFMIDDVEYDLSTTYNESDEIHYLIEGDLANLPTEWNLDPDGQLIKIAISENNYTLQFSEGDKGVFHYLKPQNALVIWHGLMFYLSPFELFFFSQHDIALIHTGDAGYLFQNKIWDGNGNLVSFQVKPNVLFGLTINYVVEYETKNL
ncbi:hypothetical protein [Flagellimonas sp.]|uniref:hypothetical protein n=1 Tax=Flagellimonas sp. TaxID=2058762 RepID=UPI003AB150DA